jgi:hypothetical protein
MQNTRTSFESGRGFRLAEAAGQRISLVIFLVVLALGYVGWVLLTPRLTAYSLEAAIPPVCRQFMNWHFAGRVAATNADRSLDWERDWLQRTRQIGLNLRNDQYDFRTSPTCTKQACTCTGEAVFELSTPWPILEDFLDIAPYKSTHHVIKHVEWRSSY